MLYFRNFILFFARLKKCSNGSFFIVSAILFSSFFSIADVLMDCLKIMEDQRIVAYISDHLIYNIIPKSLGMSTNNRTKYISTSLNMFLKDNQKGFDLTNEQINNIVDTLHINYVHNNKMSLIANVLISHKAKLKGLILKKFSTEGENFSIYIQKKIKFTKNIVFIDILYTKPEKMILNWHSSGLPESFEIFFPRLRNDLLEAYKVQRFNFISQLFENLISEEGLCLSIAPYTEISLWSFGDHLDMRRRLFYAHKNHSAFDVTPFQATKEILLYNKAFVPKVDDRCHIVENSRRYILFLSFGNQISKFDFKLDCDDSKKNGKGGLINNMFSVGIFPDPKSRKILKDCASNPSQYYEIKSSISGEDVANKLADSLKNHFSYYNIAVHKN